VSFDPVMHDLKRHLRQIDEEEMFENELELKVYDRDSGTGVIPPLALICRKWPIFYLAKVTVVWPARRRDEGGCPHNGPASTKPDGPGCLCCGPIQMSKSIRGGRQQLKG